MMSGGQLNVELVEDVSESSSGNNSTENSPKSLLCPTFAAVDYLEVKKKVFLFVLLLWRVMVGFFFFLRFRELVRRSC